MNLLKSLTGVGVTFGRIAVRPPVHQQILGGPHPLTVKAGEIGRVLGHADGVFGAGFNAKAAEDAARVVNFETVRGFGVERVVQRGGGLDFYAVGRTDGGAHYYRIRTEPGHFHAG